MVANHLELWQYLAQEKRTDLKKTNKKFAEKLGINPATLSRISNYRHCPGVDLAKKIEEASGYQVLWYDLLERCSNLTKT